MFYLHDTWTSFIDTSYITTYKSFRSIREGFYQLDEHRTKLFLKKIYDIPENIRDVVAGFMVFRLVDLSKYANGETFTINGFYEDEGYKIKVLYLGLETIKTDRGKMVCYKVRPTVPKNHVFNGSDAVNVWMAADKSKSIIRIRVNMFVGNVQIDLQK